MHLTAFEEDMAAGGQGAAAAFAMDILLRFGEAIGAPALLEIVQAHVDGCLYHGEVSLDFVERLVAEGGRVRAPTTLNVGSMDLLHPELIGGAAALRSAGRRLMEAHLALGCERSFTCAPYQTRFRPRQQCTEIQRAGSTRDFGYLFARAESAADSVRLPRRAISWLEPPTRS